jgi:hypothetical protein
VRAAGRGTQQCEERLRSPIRRVCFGPMRLDTDQRRRAHYRHVAGEQQRHLRWRPGVVSFPAKEPYAQRVINSADAKASKGPPPLHTFLRCIGNGAEISLRPAALLMRHLASSSGGLSLSARAALATVADDGPTRLTGFATASGITQRAC